MTAPRATDPLLVALGHRVRGLREGHHLTRRALSERSGVSERYLADLESGRGNISVARLAQVARALGLPTRDLLPAEDGERPAIALLGLRGAGKSTVGPRLAERLGVPFVELDARVEAEAGLTLRELFDFHGEAYYRRVEREVLEGVLGHPGGAVIATGGGIVTSPEAFELLQRQATTVWLKADPEDHWHRVVDQGDPRPMADNPHAMAELRALLAERAPLYARARYTVDTSVCGVDQVVERTYRMVQRTVVPSEPPPPTR